MSEQKHVGIAGTGHYVPERVVPNSYFEEFIDTTDEWICQRTGIQERRFAADDEATSDLCIKAGRRAMEAAGIGPLDIDLIVVGTISPDQYLPACAPLVQTALGAKRAAAFDVNAACTGFLTALSIADAAIRAGRAKIALVFGAETLSRYLDMEDRTSCILFGDGAGAVVLRAQEAGEQAEILRIELGSDGTGYEFIQMLGGGSRRPWREDSNTAREQYIRVRGRDVFRFAVTTMTSTVSTMLEGHDAEEFGILVPHQVNLRIIDAAAEKLEIPMDRVFVNIAKYGNTSAASVPIALDEAVREGRMESGKLVVMCAFGAGLNWGGALLRW